MYKFLDIISIEELSKKISTAVESNFINEGLKLKRDSLYGILFGIYGYDILYEKQIRLLLLKTLNDVEISELTKKLNLKPKKKI